MDILTLLKLLRKKAKLKWMQTEQKVAEVLTTGAVKYLMNSCQISKEQDPVVTDTLPTPTPPLVCRKAVAA